MTVYEINKIYENKYADKINEDVYNYIFKSDIKNTAFNKPEQAEIICRLRLEGHTYKYIAERIERSVSLVRSTCVLILRKYNNYIRQEKHKKMKDAKDSNFSIFCRNLRLCHHNIEDTATEIAKLPIWNIENEEERKERLIEWFYKEV